ncbi:ABC transporter permease subunit [Planococcus sp. CAU13]|uniref:ABC transporter permease subunit n=1 Tax=Planococcus sp. CAU13 TaxID=1541197 RepID=UPI00052FDE49|nr:ABC transporter permease subunit [Planococcus sp. CAU13]
MNRTLWIGLIMTGMLLFIMIFGPYLPRVDPAMEQSLLKKENGVGLLVPPYAPSEEFLIGSDRKGVDLWSKVMIGARETFYILAVIVGLRLVLALLVSIGAFYLSGVRLLMNIWNAVFSFMPTIFIILILLAVPGVMFSDYRPFWVMAIISVVEVGRLSLIFYESLHTQKRQTYMEAAIASGGRKWTLFKGYYWPALKREVLSSSATEAGRAMFLLAQLGVIGIYINQEFFSQLDRSYQSVEASNSWPVLLSNLRRDVYSAEWIPLVALFFMTFSIIAFYLLADGLRKRQTIKMRRDFQ